MSLRFGAIAGLGAAVFVAAAYAAPGGPAIPSNLPATAAQAMQLAQKWHRDAQMIDLRVREASNYEPEFLFKSPSDRGMFSVRMFKGKLTTQVMPPVTANTPDPLPLQFLDLPQALAKARQRGMPPLLKEAELQASSSESSRLSWAIMPETDRPPYLYTVDAATGAVSSVDQFSPGEDPNNRRRVNRPK